MLTSVSATIDAIRPDLIRKIQRLLPRPSEDTHVGIYQVPFCLSIKHADRDGGVMCFENHQCPDKLSPTCLDDMPVESLLAVYQELATRAEKK